MTTQLFYTDTLASLTISSTVVRSMSTSRGSGVITKTDNSAALGVVKVTDDGSLQLVFAYQVSAYSSTTGTYNFNHWGSESSAMANFGATADDNVIGGVDVYTNAGVRRFTICADPAGVSAEYGLTAAVKTFSTAGTAQTINNGDWIVVFPAHGAVGSGAAGFTLMFSYNGTTSAADGDSFVTLPDTVTAFAAAANPVYAYPALTVRNNRRILL